MGCYDNSPKINNFNKYLFVLNSNVESEWDPSVSWASTGMQHPPHANKRRVLFLQSSDIWKGVEWYSNAIWKSDKLAE